MNFESLRYVLTSIWRDPSNRGQRLRRLILLLRWQVRKRIVRTPLITTLCNVYKLEVWPDCDVSPAALYYSLPYGQSMAFLRKHVGRGTLIDVGANIGLVSLLLADKIQHAILFEPNPVAAGRARRNLELNGLKFEVVAKALSDVAGSVALENREGASSCNRTVEGFVTESPTIMVERIPFDQYWGAHGARLPEVCAVKIDVEGHENSVLLGMKGFLKNQRPPLVLFEYLGRTDLGKALNTFASVHYTVFELQPSGPHRATSEVAPLQDLFACPDELVAAYGVKSS